MPPNMPHPRPLPLSFFDRDPEALALALLGKLLCRRAKSPDGGRVWLHARIIETEAYYRHEKGSHSSLGRTPSREAMFDPPGTFYMYYARGADSLNFSARGDGNAVLVKSAWPTPADDRALAVMQANNPGPGGIRPQETLCRGQTLLCKSLYLSVAEWNRRQPDPAAFYVGDDGEEPAAVIICPRLGIPAGRDEHLPYRFVDERYARFATSNPLTKRQWREGRDYIRKKMTR